MSNYHYDDRTTCATNNCRSDPVYLSEVNTANNGCDSKCIDRNNKERSNRDQMDYNFYVLGQPVQYPLLKVSKEWQKHTYIQNDTL